eukprot:SAG11_NODE_25341_length_360_cov_0.720307_1_plen_53_part_10
MATVAQTDQSSIMRCPDHSSLQLAAKLSLPVNGLQLGVTDALLQTLHDGLLGR